MRRVLGAAAAAALLVATGCTADQQAVEPTTVRLDSHDLPGPVHVGVLVTLRGAPGEGSEWLASSSGARVAAYQYHMGGKDVVLDVVDDRGTAQGAERAVGQLVGDGVSGIVAATSGAHVQAAVDAATAQHVPILLPYATDDSGLGDGAWLTGPSADQLGSALADALTSRDLTAPMLLLARDAQLPGVDGYRKATTASGDGAATVVREVRAGLKLHSPIDALVIDAPAQVEAAIVSALQGAKVDLPVLLGRQAVSPEFGSALADDGGSLAAELTTAGLDAGDVSSMGAGPDADRAAAFYSALRIAAGDDAAQDMFGQGSFANRAGAADIASHDAVVALVTAVAKAGSAAPADVLGALTGLKVTGGDGLAGPDLDFSAPTAVADDAVVPLHATPQDPGVRPAGVGALQRLFWFAVPAASS